MTWTRVSDDFVGRPDLLEVSRSARLLIIEMRIYGNKYLTDGTIPVAALRMITDSKDLEDDLMELVAAGFAVPAEDGKTYQIDWSDQERADVVQARKDGWNKRQTESRARKALHAIGDHSQCLSPSCRGDVTRDSRRDVTTDVTSSVTPSPSHPNPFPALKAGKGVGGAQRCPNGIPIAADGACCDACAHDQAAMAADAEPAAALAGGSSS